MPRLGASATCGTRAISTLEPRRARKWISTIWARGPETSRAGGVLRSAMSYDESYPELISLAVHELRTPLSVVGGYLRMVLRDPASPIPERQRKMLEEAEKSCARLGALVGELSDVGKLDDGRIALKRGAVDVFS